MDNSKTLKSKIAFLESQLDHYESELTSLNTLLIDVGFSEGIQTLKLAVNELKFEEQLP